MNPFCNQKYKTTLCRHWQSTGSCSIGLRCVFAHGQQELRNPNDPITINQNILSDPKMLGSLMSTPSNDLSHMNATMAAQKLESLKQERENLKKALFEEEHSDSYKNSTNKQVVKKPHFDITSDPAVQKRITAAQMNLMAREILKLEMHPIIRCKVEIALELLEAENIDACVLIMNEIIERPTSSQYEQSAYERIIEQAGQLAFQLIAEEKVKYQKLQRDQEMLIKRQTEQAMYREYEYGSAQGRGY